MKLSLLKKVPSPAAMLAVASISCLGLSQQADAGVTWIATDDGSNLTLTTDGGSLNAGTTTDSTFEAFGFPGLFTGDSTNVYVAGGVHGRTVAGSEGGNDPWILGTMLPNSTSGHIFGNSNTSLNWDPVFGNTPGTFTPTSSMVFTGLTVSSAFGTNLDSGPVLLWTHNTTGDTISVSLVAVPEPSSSITIALGLAGIMLRRRRK